MALKMALLQTLRDSNYMMIQFLYVGFLFFCFFSFGGVAWMIYDRVVD